MAIDFYDVLGIPAGASPDEVRRAYREQVKRYHPDVNDHPRAHAQFKVLKTARDVLVDPVERKAYDRLGHHDYIRERLDGDLPTTDFPTTDRQSVGSDPRDRRNRDTVSAAGRDVTETGDSAGTRTRGGYHSTSRSETSYDVPTIDRAVRYLWALLTVVTTSYVGIIGGLLWTATDDPWVAELATVAHALPDQPFRSISRIFTDRFGIPPLDSFIFPIGLSEPNSIGLLLLVLIGLVPMTFFGTIVLLRRRTIWSPSWMYVFGALGPSIGLFVNRIGIRIVIIDMVLYILLPILVLAVFLYHRFS